MVTYLSYNVHNIKTMTTHTCHTIHNFGSSSQELNKLQQPPSSTLLKYIMFSKIMEVAVATSNTLSTMQVKVRRVSAVFDDERYDTRRGWYFSHFEKIRFKDSTCI